MTTNRRLQIQTSREISEESFGMSVVSSLGKLSNLVGLDRHDREELQTLATPERVAKHWHRLVEDTSGHAVQEWEWNRHVRAATRECVSAWGQL